MPVLQLTPGRFLLDRAGEKFNSLSRSSYTARDGVGIGDAISLTHPERGISPERRRPSVPTSIDDTMKDAFALSCLIPLAGYFVALAAQTLGVVSIPLPNISAFIGIYVVAGILSLAFADYFRQTNVCSKRVRRTASRRDTVTALHGLSLTNSTLGSH